MRTAIFNGSPIVVAPRASLGATVGRLGAALEEIARWRDRARGRRQLAGIDDRGLADIGITRADVFQETRKWFWQA